MRITILSRDFPPAVSGIGDHTDLLAAELARRGHAVSVVCSGPADERASFDVHAVDARFDAAGTSSILPAVEATEPDVIVWQYNPFAIGRRGLAPFAGRFARALAARAPLVLLAHELWFPAGRGGVRGLVWALAHRLQTRAALRASRSVIVTTGRRAEELARVARRTPVHVVPIGANIEPRDPVAGARASLGIPDDAFVLAHLGSVGPGRELGPVFEAVRALRERGTDVRVLLAGNTGPFERPPSLNGAVIATGTLTRARLSEALSSADAYVHPDPSGPAAGRRGSLMAALAHGLPVLAYRGPDHAPQLEDGRNCLVVEPDGSSVARALTALAEDRARARSLGEAARATYTASFSWPRVADGVLRAAEEAIGR